MCLKVSGLVTDTLFDHRHSNALLPLVMIAPCQSFKVGTIRPHDLDIVHIVVCINHILIEIHVVGEAMLSDSFAHLQEHFVLLGRAKLLIRTNVEVVARDTLGRVVLLFAFLSAILGIVE